MPTNTQMERCIALESDALVFWSPEERLRGAGARVQIIDVFALQVASGTSRDDNGRRRLEAQRSMAAGRSWNLTRALQLIRDDEEPRRWVALQLDRRAWGLFWAGGGLQECRQRLEALRNEAEAAPSPRPATPEALLRWLVDRDPRRAWLPAAGGAPWRPAGWRSVIVAGLLGLSAGLLLGWLPRQERPLEPSPQPIAPAGRMP